MTFNEMKASIHDLHPIDWDKTNTTMPNGSYQCEYWQFRINKSKGRVIGVMMDGVFYIVWLDPHHNLTNSEGYGTENWYKPALSLYETQERTIGYLREEINRLTADLKAAEDLLNDE